jgi:hypothetical protein
MGARASEETSQNWMTLEILFLMVPICLALALGSGPPLGHLTGTFKLRPLDAVFAGTYLSIVCLWRLVFRFILGGATGLRALSIIWWCGAGLGGFIALGALVSCLAPASPEYTPWWDFRRTFNLFVIGLPLLAPLLHLAWESFWRRSRGEAPAPEAGSAARSAGGERAKEVQG